MKIVTAIHQKITYSHYKKYSSFSKSKLKAARAFSYSRSTLSNRIHKSFSSFGVRAYRLSYSMSRGRRNENIVVLRTILKNSKKGATYNEYPNQVL
jgi:hypothetical protein